MEAPCSPSSPEGLKLGKEEVEFNCQFQPLRLLDSNGGHALPRHIGGQLTLRPILEPVAGCQGDVEPILEPWRVTYIRDVETYPVFTEAHCGARGVKKYCYPILAAVPNFCSDEHFLHLI